MPSAAPLSKPVQKQMNVSTPTAPLALKGKRPRPIDTPRGAKSTGPSPTKGKAGGVGTGGGGGRTVKPLPAKVDQSALRKGMYLAFIEDALVKKGQVSGREVESSGWWRGLTISWYRCRVIWTGITS